MGLGASTTSGIFESTGNSISLLLSAAAAAGSVVAAAAAATTTGVVAFSIRVYSGSGRTARITGAAADTLAPVVWFKAVYPFSELTSSARACACNCLADLRVIRLGGLYVFFRKRSSSRVVSGFSFSSWILTGIFASSWILIERRITASSIFFAGCSASSSVA